MKRKILFLLISLHAFGMALSFGQDTELKFDHITSEDGLPQNTIHGIAKDKYGFMWFGTWSGLCRYDGYTFKIYNYEQGNPQSINNNRIHNIIKDKNGDLWLQTFDENTLLKYNYTTDGFDRIPIKSVSPAFINSIARWVHYRTVRVRSGELEWRIDSATNTLIQSNIVSGTSKTLVSNPSSRWSLNDSYVADIYRDDQNIFWVGTYGNGINKANLSSKPFDYFYHDSRNSNSIIDDNVSAICKDKQGNFWFGTSNKGISVIRPGKNTVHLRSIPGNRNTIAIDQVRKIFCDSRGFVWIGHKIGLDGFPAGNTTDVQHFETDELKGNAVYGITEDHSGNIWLATWKGLYKYIVSEKRFIRFLPGSSDQLLRSRVIMEDYSGQIWSGTDGKGINVVRETSPGKITIVKQFVRKDNTRNSIGDNRIYSIIEDTDRMIWIATGNGLDRYDPFSNTFKHFTVAPNGLVNATISAILEDNRGKIWISHKKGISEIDKQTFAVTNYSRKDGLQSNEFIDGSCYEDEVTGILYFGGSNGYNSFLPGTIKPDRTLPRTVLTELQILNKPVETGQKVNDRVVLARPLYLSKEIELGYRDKSFAIEFSALHYANPEGNKYAYMLEGFDKEWIYTDASRRIASYSNLDAGTYVFKVKASNSDGVWNPRPATLRIMVNPPFWASTWAYVGYGLLAALIAWLYHYYTTRFARLRSKLAYEVLIHEKENELHQDKFDFFTNISHEIKTPLSLILAPLEMLTTMPETPPRVSAQLKTMKSNGDRLLKLINQLLDIRRLETGNDQVNLELRDLAGFAEDITRAFHDSAMQRSINLQFSASEKPFLFRFDPDKIEKILYNLLSNAFKFTREGGSIRVGLANTMIGEITAIAITVTDNGTGIPPADLKRIFMPFQQGSTKQSEGTGLGLAYCKSLAELQGGTIDVESTHGQDLPIQTTFTVKIPYTKNAAADIHNATIFETQELTGPDEDENESAGIDELQTGKRATILLADDNYEMRKYLKDYLSAQYAILEACNGLEALSVSKSRSVDLVISDVMMPEMDGLELCRILKTDAGTNHIPVILLTARTVLEVQLEGLGVGADAYITKPFNLALLSLKINNILLSQERIREQYKATLVIEPSSFTPVTADEKLLKKMLEYVEENLADPNLNVDKISDNLYVTKIQLYRKTKALTGLTTVDLIKKLRLKRAKTLLTDKKFNVNEVTYMVGFTDANYFRKCFKAEFSISPSEFAKHGLET